MRLRLMWVGKTKSGPVRELTDEYLKRLRRFVTVEVTEVRESSAATDAEILAEESQRLLKHISEAGASHVVLLDVDGTEWSSPHLAAEVDSWQIHGEVKEVVFVIGGHLGVTQELKQHVGMRWSLSKLTLTHEMARAVLTEQLYRAYTILRGIPYQK